MLHVIHMYYKIIYKFTELYENRFVRDMLTLLQIKC